MLTNKAASGQSIGALRARIPVEQRHGVFLTSVTRMDHPLPTQPGTTLNAGDTLPLLGPIVVGADLAPTVSP